MLFNTNTAYLTDPRAYEICEVVDEWPQSQNPFIKRTAMNTKPGLQINQMAISQFIEYCGSLTAAWPDTTFTFAVDLMDVSAKSVVTAYLLCTEQRVTPPLSADNAGFLAFALSYFASSRPAITISISGSALFWAHWSALGRIS
jgi:hypothetical protein